MRTLIIGGGAAGLYLAALCPSAVLLEKNGECGRKLMLTGGGRCNFTHMGNPEELLPHYSGSRAFIRKVLYNHTPDDIIAFFRSLGVGAVNENGRIFPEGGDARIIRDALLGKAGRIIRGEADVITKERDGFSVKLRDGTVLKAENVVIAAGGSHYPHTGSDGSGIRLLSSLGHSIEPVLPALAPLRLERKLSAAMGITLRARISAGRHTAEGEIIITHNGISGPAALNISRWVSDSGEVSIRFAEADIRELRETFPRKEVKNALPLPARLSEALFGTLSEKKLGNLSKQEESLIASSLASFRSRAVPIASAAMSTRGGASLSGFDASTMESKLVAGLYAIGDVLDVDAETGGYSLTFAFATAFTAASALEKTE